MIQVECEHSGDTAVCNCFRVEHTMPITRDGGNTGNPNWHLCKTVVFPTGTVKGVLIQGRWTVIAEAE